MRPHCFTLLAIDYTILGTFFIGDGIFLEKNTFSSNDHDAALIFDNGRFRFSAMAADDWEPLCMVRRVLSLWVVWIDRRVLERLKDGGCIQTVFLVFSLLFPVLCLVGTSMNTCMHAAASMRCRCGWMGGELSRGYVSDPWWLSATSYLFRVQGIESE